MTACRLIVLKPCLTNIDLKRLKPNNQSDPQCVTNNCDKNEAKREETVTADILKKQVDELVEKFNQVADVLQSPKIYKPEGDRSKKKRDISVSQKVFHERIAVLSTRVLVGVAVSRSSRVPDNETVYHVSNRTRMTTRAKTICSMKRMSMMKTLMMMMITMPRKKKTTRRMRAFKRTRAKRHIRPKTKSTTMISTTRTMTTTRRKLQQKLKKTTMRPKTTTRKSLAHVSENNDEP